MADIKDIKVELFGQQWDAFHSKKQFIGVCCGSQSGKTYLGALWSLRKMGEFPDNVGLISAPTYKILQQSTLEKFFSVYPRLRKYYKQQREEIVIPERKGRVFVRSAEKPLGIEGMSPMWEWLDEYGQASRLAWTVCKTRVSVTGGQIMITTTPYALNWLYTDFFKPWKEGIDPRLDFYSWKSIDNPYFSREHWEAERAVLGKAEFDRRYGGKFTRMVGLVYEDFTSDLIYESKDIKPEVVIAGVDFGYTAPAAIEVIKIDKDKHWWVDDEWYAAGKTTAEIIDACKMLRKKHGIHYFYPDIAEPDRIKEMKRAGLICRETKKDVPAGISKVRELFKQKVLHISKRCQNLLDEIEVYHYKEEKDLANIKEEPVKEKDHGCDAIRYAIYTHNLPTGKGGFAGFELPKPKSTTAEGFNIDIEEIARKNASGGSQEDWKYY